MSNKSILNLEKIKELTQPIAKLQIGLNQLSGTYSSVSNNTKIIRKDSTDDKFLSQLDNVEDLLNNINFKLNGKLKSNLNKFLDFQNKLIKKYKEIFKNKLKNLNIDQSVTKSIGLFLIENKYISKTIDFVSFIPSIQVPHWLELLDSLKYNTLFIKSIKKTKDFYQKLIDLRYKKELEKIPVNTDPDLIREYEKWFLEYPILTFSEFLKNMEDQLGQQELKAKKEFIKKVKEKEEIEKLKKKQEQQKEAYEEYLKLSNKEFERLRRKKSREKLPKTSKKSHQETSIELSDEVSEKIKKFKSQFEKSFDKEYMIQKDEDKDPIDLIRERKKRKDKEFKEYKEHFDNL
ncbi:MAG: hypothetical protein ACFE9Z_14465 [Promethearchaeota archaeon]